MIAAFIPLPLASLMVFMIYAASVAHDCHIIPIHDSFCHVKSCHGIESNHEILCVLSCHVIELHCFSDVLVVVCTLGFQVKVLIR